MSRGCWSKTVALSSAVVGLDTEVRCSISGGMDATLGGRDFILLEPVLDALSFGLASNHQLCTAVLSYLSLVYFSGMCIVKVVPTPNVLLRSIFPPIRVANWWQILKPSPVPPNFLLKPKSP